MASTISRLDLLVDRVRARPRRRALLDEQPAEPLDRAAGLPALDVLARAVRVVAHPLGVGPGPIGLALDQGRPAAAAGAVDGLVRGLRDGQDVVAVDLDAGQAVALGAAGDAGVAAGVLERDLGGELVVLADEQHGQLPDAGHVQPFVEGAVVHGAVAEEGHGHAVGFEELEAVAGAGGLEDARADDPAGAHQADLGGEQVHAAAAAVRAAGGAAE